MPRRAVLWLLAVLLIACLSVSQAGTDTESYEHGRQLALILRTIQRDYYKEVTTEELFSGAFRGMVGTLDDYSQYLDGQVLGNFRSDTTGRFGGLGIEITTKDGILTVVAPIAGTPAYKAGILPGDRILKIDGESTERLPLSEAVKILRGAPGTKVVLTVHHQGSRLDRDITVVRAIIEPVTVVHEMVADDPAIALIRVNSFNAHVMEEFDAALKAAKEAGARGLILDLRNNPGGILSAAIGMCDRFLSDGVIVSVRGRHENRTYRATEGATSCEMPIAVLINGGSASASEIVAAAIKENGRGLIVGERSFGKGSVQNVIFLDEKESRALKLTIAQYYTPLDHAIDLENSVTPDVEIRMSVDQLLGLRMQRQEDKMRDNGPHDDDPDKPAGEVKDKPEDKPKDKPEEKSKGDAPEDADADASEDVKRRSRVRDIQLDGAVAILRAQVRATRVAVAK